MPVLGRSDLHLSPVVLGTMAYGKARSKKERIQTIHAAIDHGITSLDTAPLYGFGESEMVVGEAIADRRARVQVLTKVGLRWDDTHGEVMLQGQHAGRRIAVRKDSRPAAIRRDVEESLRRLRIETIDLCQVHHLDASTPVGETMRVLRDLRTEGKVRAIGVSNYPAAAVEEAVHGLGDVPLASHQLEYSLLVRGAENELLPQAERQGIGVLVYSPLHRGVLGGRASRRGRLALDDPRQFRPGFVYGNARAIDAVVESALGSVARRHGVDVAQVALAWLLARPAVTGVIVGARSPAQAIANARVSEVALAPEEHEAIGRAFDRVFVDPDRRPPTWQQWERRARKLARKVVGRVARALPLPR